MNSMQELIDQASATPVVTVVAPPGPADAVWLAEILVDEGFPLLEITFRNEHAAESIAAVQRSVPGVRVGAGTVLTSGQAAAAVDAGAGYLVSPGLSSAVLAVARSHDLPYLPGTVTPTEIQHALEEGLSYLKFFPASVYGGTAAIRALSAVYPDVRFMPTGGISLDTLGDYLAVPAVLACGGSFLAPADAIRDRDESRIRAVAAAVRELL